MDGNVHTYKARLVVKGFTQTFGVDYEEMFSPIVDIRAIRILIAITAFYDYEIWQMDVKTTFLNDYLNEDIYMVQPEGFIDPKHPRKVCKLQRSIYGLNKDPFMVLSKHQGAGIKDLMRKSKGLDLLKILMSHVMDNSKRGNIPMQEKLDLNKTQGASTPEENLGEPHWTDVKTILKYLRYTKYMFLVFGGNPEAELLVDCYCNVGFETDRDDTKS
ncbi:retrotransposon protein, putative, ty1-copia subclass [Tanacetum coccineum]